VSLHGTPVRIVDDDPDLLLAQVQTLRLAGFAPEPFPAAAPALQGLSADYPGVVLTDVRMPGMDGLELQRRIRAIDPDLPVILLTGHGDVPMAVAALKSGAWDFLTKPAGADQLSAALRRAAQARALVLENRLLREGIGAASGEDPFLWGNSPVATHLRQTIDRIAETGVNALIIGPVGAGKEAVARALHAKGNRRSRPFVHVICAALEESRFEADFFGQVAPGGRAERIPGLVERAQRGTIFLDSIDTLSPALQARLLSILGKAEFLPSGATSPRPLDVRILASTATDLSLLASRGDFRPDLLYRLSGVSIQVPPISARHDDVQGIFRRLLLGVSRRQGLPVPFISAATQARLDGHDWPGNLRELQQFAEAVGMGLGEVPAFGDDGGKAAKSLPDQVADYEATVIRSVLKQTGGSIVEAIRLLQIPRKTLYDKMARHGINPSDFR